MWSRHLKYLRSYSLINDPLLPSPIFVPCIYGSGFRSLVHCHKALAFCHIRHWLGAPEEHLSKDNTSVSMPYHQFLLGAQPNFDWTKHYSHCHWNDGTCKRVWEGTKSWLAVPPLRFHPLHPRHLIVVSDAAAARGGIPMKTSPETIIGSCQ